MTEAKKDERNIRQRLIDAMADMENPKKSKTANGGKFTYQYESLDQVLECIRPHLTENGLGLTQNQQWKGGEQGYVLVTSVFDANDELVLDTRPMRDFGNDAQAAGSWETYMRRYALRCSFGLTGEDDDGAATRNAKKTKSQPNPKKATHSQIAAINDAAAAFAVMKDKPLSDVLTALVASNSVKAAGVPEGTAIEALTDSQAAVALGVIRTWADKAEQEASAAELADEDIPF